MAEDKDPELTFEQAMSRLEAIVAEMEAGRLPLEQSMARFEEGMGLSRFCAEKLDATEKKIEMLVRKTDNQLEWQTVAGRSDAQGREQPPTA